MKCLMCTGMAVWHEMCVKHVREFAKTMNHDFQIHTPHAGILHEGEKMWLIWRGFATPLKNKSRGELLYSAAYHYMLTNDMDIDKARGDIGAILYELGLPAQHVYEFMFLAICKDLRQR